MKALFILALLVGIVIGPLVTILAVNTLFDTQIAYSFINWLAVAWLCLVFGGSRTNTDKQQY